MPANYFYRNSKLKIKHCHNKNSGYKEKTIDLMPRKPKTVLSKIM